jgi:dienelactone hydrolase
LIKTRSIRTALAALALAASITLVGPTPAHAAIQHGPAPTASALQANGPYAVSTTSVPDFVTDGFGAGTLYYPTTTAEGTFGGVVVVPGYTGTQSSISWYGPRLASHGFVVFTIDTNSRYDQPDSRATQLLAALDYMRTSPAVGSRVDHARVAVMGHSMGGGGTLRATERRPSIKAAIPLTPWHTDKTWGANTTPTLIFGAEDDSVAPVSSHAEPFYSSLTSAREKAYLELNGASHFAPNSTNSTISLYSIAWLKRFVDDDTRYDQFLCPPPAAPSSTIQEYRNTCPNS